MHIAQVDDIFLFIEYPSFIFDYKSRTGIISYLSDQNQSVPLIPMSDSDPVFDSVFCAKWLDLPVAKFLV
jgi:hypothetical protein